MKLYAGESRKLPPLYDKLADGTMRPVTATVIEWALEPATLGSVADGRLLADIGASGRTGLLTATASYADGRAFQASCPVNVVEVPTIQAPPPPPAEDVVEDLLLIDPD